jgi:hypothetical protein
VRLDGAGETSDFFSILLENPCQLRMDAHPPAGGASIPPLEG